MTYTKTLEQDEQGQLIVNQNSLRTTTRNVFRIDLTKTYTPLENGFNKELADAALEVIRHNRMLWSQGTWRTILHVDRQSSQYEEFRSQFDELVNDVAPEDRTHACGTAMCFAGWTAELTGVDHVVDMAYLVNVRAGAAPYTASTIDRVLVPREEFSAWTREHQVSSSIGYLTAWTELYPEQQDHLAKRGFTDETHVIIDLFTFACWKLGLPQADWLEAFAGGNSLESIQASVEAYARFGPTYETWEEKRTAVDWRWERTTELVDEHEGRTRCGISGDGSFEYSYGEDADEDLQAEMGAELNEAEETDDGA